MWATGDGLGLRRGRVVRARARVEARVHPLCDWSAAAAKGGTALVLLACGGSAS